MSLVDVAISAVLQAVMLAGFPFLGYLLVQRWRHGRTFRDVAARAGLQVGDPRGIAWSAAFAIAIVVAILAWWPPLEPFTREGSAQRQFAGLGLGAEAITRACLYGALQTGFAEELLFRGLIAGSLSRVLPALWANLTQAAIFLVPHLAILAFAPELWGMLPIVFIGALILGWIRLRSNSIAGPVLMHAAGNVTMALMVAARTAP